MEAAYLKGLLHGSHTISHGSSGGFVGLIIAKDRTTTALLGSQKQNQSGERTQIKVYKYMYAINHVINELLNVVSETH